MSSDYTNTLGRLEVEGIGAYYPVGLSTLTGDAVFYRARSADPEDIREILVLSRPVISMTIDAKEAQISVSGYCNERLINSQHLPASVDLFRMVTARLVLSPKANSPASAEAKDD